MFKVIKICFVLGLLVMAQHSYALNFAGNAKTVTKLTDTSKINLRHFNKAAIFEYSKKPEFRYDENSSAGLSLWSRFWLWVWYWVGRLFNQLFSGNVSWRIFGYLLLAVFVGFLVYVIFKVLGIDIIKLLRGESEKIDVPYSESLENIHEINFDDEIEKAVTTKNYRLAVRLLYLRSLKQLSDLQLIHWQIEKTNAVYVNELTDADLRHSFSWLTTQFEYIWYGDFSLDGPGFQNIMLLFQDFKQRMK